MGLWGREVEVPDLGDLSVHRGLVEKFRVLGEMKSRRGQRADDACSPWLAASRALDFILWENGTMEG